ncbi:MAG: hypothetical protein QXS17_02380 [Candidatus Micrarchaeaceae archaeon]
MRKQNTVAFALFVIRCMFVPFVVITAATMLNGASLLGFSYKILAML